MNKLQQAPATLGPHIGPAQAYTAEHTIATTRRDEDDGPMSLEQAANARREAEYIARRNGVKEPLLQLWKVMH
ncbi:MULTISPECIES: hypothetical protein [Modicisalibacter]|uniref:hypothetical protein n=1 Tax=Modicisalibacter TaxID=574347 RepID=UPI00100B572E|nr:MULTISPECIES: hypothetical protein [Halomonadaceae]MBZ9556920.1 hypothetical protein [Modicisalibacter sp. R2A 31.J]MBZ9574367.1 hypothetical protein [Modicisalibacter sp. MOD 31.J]